MNILTLIARLIRGTALPTAAELIATVAAPTSNPWLGARGATTGIVTNLGTAVGFRVNCIVRDGRGQPVPNAILRIYTGSLVDTATTSVATGTLLIEAALSTTAAGAIGGVVMAQADGDGIVDATVGVGAVGGDGARVVLEFLGHAVTTKIVTT